MYRKNRKNLVDALLPYNQAQALHPVPYPNESEGGEDLRRDWEAQIFNSFVNGIILGYPQHFVQNYCESFHNGLSWKEKVREIERAKNYIQQELIDDQDLELVQIGKGLDSDIVAQIQIDR